jgi:hypothetical protein
MLQDLAKTWHMATEAEAPKFRKLDLFLEMAGTGRDTAHQEQ